LLAKGRARAAAGLLVTKLATEDRKRRTLPVKDEPAGPARRAGPTAAGPSDAWK